MAHVGSLGSSGPSVVSGPSDVSRRPSEDSRCRFLAGPGLAKAREQASSLNPRGFSDRELLSRVKDLVSWERDVTLEILLHLIEIERRRLHVGLGYSSMFEYAVRHLGYSESAAARRIRSARCIRDYPEVRRVLEKNEVNLITISLVASIFTASNAKDVIETIRGKSQREVEAIVAAYRPPVSMRDRAKPVCVAVPVPSVVQTQRTSEFVGASAGSEKRPSVAASSAGGPPQASTDLQALRRASTQPSEHLSPSPAIGDSLPATSGAEGGTSSPSAHMERRFLVQFLASPGFMQKFEKAKALLSNKNGKPSYEAVLEAALDEFLKDHDPEQREQRREERREKFELRTNAGNRVSKKAVQPHAARHDGSQKSGEDRSRHIPPSTRDAVFKRDKGRCTYAGLNGVRCGATHRLQIDHIVPYARGGTNAAANLRLLCERHNKQEAERVYGADKMKRFRARE